MPQGPVSGDGWTIASIDDLGDGPGFRKVRQALGVTEFGANAVVLPPGYTSRRHRHERQQELYLILSGEVEIELSGERHVLGPGGLARVDAPTVRSLRNTSDTDEAVYFCVGGEGGYVGRDGQPG
jgi:uncharacterized cupin superfamily protein